MGRTVYLARHGETEWNRALRWQGSTDIPLNEVGRRQAEGLGEALRDQGIGRAYASDLSRARETAVIAAHLLGVGPVVTDPRLRERAFGCFEGLTREECAVRFPDEWERYHADPRTCPPGGEPQNEVVARMRQAVLEAAFAVAQDGTPDGPTLVVSHGGAIRAFVGSVTGEPPPPLGNGALFRLAVLADGFADVARLM